jgi:hypothetical protein
MNVTKNIFAKLGNINSILAVKKSNEKLTTYDEEKLASED